MNPNAPNKLNKCQYKLTGIVHHFGEVDYGHYTAAVLSSLNKKWYLINDSKAN
jgi:ubiquitin C-terminal hydrolase